MDSSRRARQAETLSSHVARLEVMKMLARSEDQHSGKAGLATTARQEGDLEDCMPCIRGPYCSAIGEKMIGQPPSFRFTSRPTHLRSRFDLPLQLSTRHPVANGDTYSCQIAINKKYRIPGTNSQKIDHGAQQR